MTSSPPKRKRGENCAPSPSIPSLHPSQINTTFSQDPRSLLSSPHNSPRTKVVWRFQGLELSRSNPSRPPLLPPESPLSPSEKVRKRVKVLDADSEPERLEVPETPMQAPNFKINFGPERAAVVDPFIQETANGIKLQNSIDPVIFSVQKTFAKPRTNSIKIKKRAGTPPLQHNSKTSASFPPAGKPFVAVDAQERKEVSSFLDSDTETETDPTSLTWHDDEITGHLFDDPEDDGEGINGIGFKPSALQAQQRLEKRRQQMADYKTREMREARAKRGARRRGSAPEMTGGNEDVETGRRVRFLDNDMAGIGVDL